MNYQFVECTHSPEEFFSILPADWRESIVPFWPEYRDSARIFILRSANEVVGGGIVFATVSPDTRAYREEAQAWFDRGYLYIGFLWVAEAQRGRQLGSRWLTELQERLPGQRFWLAIEDEGLAEFYRRNGFAVVKAVEVEGGQEWILVGRI